MEALIQKRKDDNATALEKKETELAALQAQLEAAEGKPKTKASLEKKIAAKQAEVDEAKSPSGIQSEDEYEGMVPLEDYKAEVTSTFVPILSEGKHVEVNLHNHFVHLVEINSDGPVVDEVGEGGGKRLQLSWAKARALGYFQANTVYSRD